MRSPAPGVVRRFTQTPAATGALIARMLARFGRSGESIAVHAARIWLLVWGVIRVLVRGRMGFRDFMARAFEMGVQSVPLVVVVAVLAGVVTSQQGGYQFTGSVPPYVLGSVVSSSIVLELGPILTVIVFIGRVGARITAEIGTMSVSEQLDALQALGRDPVRVLAKPRIVAGVLVMPLLVGIADTIGVYAGMVVARSTPHIGSETFFYGARLFYIRGISSTLC